MVTPAILSLIDQYWEHGKIEEHGQNQTPNIGQLKIITLTILFILGICTRQYVMLFFFLCCFRPLLSGGCLYNPEQRRRSVASLQASTPMLPSSIPCGKPTGVHGQQEPPR